MTPLRYLRTVVLDLSLEALAERLGRTAATVSKWELGHIPEPPMRGLREFFAREFHARNLPWHDSLLFEVPVCDECHSPGTCGAMCARLAGDGGGQPCALEARGPEAEAA